MKRDVLVKIPGLLIVDEEGNPVLNNDGEPLYTPDRFEMTSVEMTPEEIEAREAEEEPVGSNRPLAEILSEAFDQQPLELRARFAPLRAAVKLELDLGHTDVAAKIIELAEIPEELEPVRAQLLEMFNA